MGWVLGATQRPPKQIYFMVSGANVFIVLECLTKSWLCDMALAVVSCAFTICYSDSKCLGLHCMFIP